MESVLNCKLTMTLSSEQAKAAIAATVNAQINGGLIPVDSKVIVLPSHVTINKDDSISYVTIDLSKAFTDTDKPKTAGTGIGCMKRA